MIRITTGSGPRATVELPRPIPGALLVVRNVPGRQYHPRLRRWSIPNRHVPTVVEELLEAGYRVAVNDEIQKGSSNPFLPLRASTDAGTWRRVASALSEALDPEWGVDVRLFDLLQNTNRVAQEESRPRAS